MDVEKWPFHYLFIKFNYSDMLVLDKIEMESIHLLTYSEQVHINTLHFNLEIHVFESLFNFLKILFLVLKVS